MIDNQSFIINDFEDVDGISKSVMESNTIPKLHLGEVDRINGIYTGIDTGSEVIILLQTSNKGRILKKKFTIFEWQGTFKKLDDGAIVLDSKLAGILKVDKKTKIGKLKFYSFREIRKLFDMSGYYREASEEQFKQFIEHPLFNIPIDFNSINTEFNRNRVGVILRDKLLENCDAKTIFDVAQKRNVSIEITDDGRLRLPNDKSEFKRFLKLLAEDYFEGDFSKHLYSSNSKIKVSK